MIRVDARGKACPEPVVLAIKELDALAAANRPGEWVEVLVDNEVAVENLKRLASSRSFEVQVSTEPADSAWRVCIGGGGSSEPIATASKPDDAGVARGAASSYEGKIVAVGSEFFGRGDDQLGALLMKGLIYALAAAALPPAKMVFFNGGAKLTCEGSAALEDIRVLEQRGCEVWTCGTCLDYYGIKERLAVGGITNLYAISEMLMSPEGVVSL